MAHYKSDIIDIDLNTGNINRNWLNHCIGQKDDDADRFGIRAFRDGVPVDLSGASCHAWFLNSQGTTIALTSYGTVDGNEAYVTLPPACYDYEGKFTLAIKIVGGGISSTVRIVDGMVDNINVGGAVTPTSAVPTYSEILSQYDAMVAATSAANLAIAETFDATKAYPAGKNVINSGALYLLPEGHTANTTWENTTKVASNLGDQVTDAKSTIDNLAWTYKTCSFVSGLYIKTNVSVGETVDVEHPVTSSNNSYSIVKCRKGDKFILTGYGGNNSRLWAFTDNDYKLLSKAGSNTTGTNLELTAPQEGYLIANATTSSTRSLVHYFYFEDIVGEFAKYTKSDNLMTSARLANVLGSNRYIGSDGRPISTGSSSWRIFIYNVDGVDAVNITNNHSVSANEVITWSLIDLPFSSFSVDNARNAEMTTVIAKSDLYGNHTGVQKYYIDIPAAAKTLMVSCAAADIASYPVVIAYDYNDFYKVKEIAGNYDSLTKTIDDITHVKSPYYRPYLRWGATAFGEYYHSDDPGTSLFTASTTAAQYYSMLNTLVGDYSDYVTVTDLGVSSDETTHIYSYTFNPKSGGDGAYYKRPKFIVISGQHGFEKVAPFGIYWFIKDLLENWQSNSALAYIRNHVQLIIIPLMNPYGFNEDKYVNANGVNLNRNWGTTGWKEEGSGTAYTGPSAFSEVETQYARDVLLANTDALYMIDYHNNGQVAPGTPSGYLWHAAVTIVHDDEYFQKSFNAAKWHIDEISGHLYIDYPDYCTYAVDGHITDDNAPFRQGLAKNYACEQNIMAETMEGGAAFIGSGNRYTPAVQHMNADLLGNYLRVLLATYWYQ